MTTVRTPLSSTLRAPAWTDMAIVASLFGFLAFMFVTGRPGSLGELVQGGLQESFSFAISVQFILAVPAIFALEYVLPARSEQRGFSPSVAYDAIYMLIHLPVIAGFLVFVSGPVNDFLSANVGFLVIDSTDSWPTLLAAFVGLLVADFGAYVAHVIKHKVPLFWRFHMIHHSQKRLNLFTANRTHPVDAIIETVLLILPFFFLFPSVIEKQGAVFLLAVVAAWHTRFQHANIRTNLGPLRYLLVTPQSHRVHHSTEPEHWNSNYSNIFAWDRLFGTQHADVTSYPPTGINDPHFPEPETMRPRDFASSFVGQMLFPLDQEAVARASVGSPYDADGSDDDVSSPGDVGPGDVSQGDVSPGESGADRP